jgi:hypothetical protein
MRTHKTLACAALLLMMAGTRPAAQQAPSENAQNAALRYWMAFALMRDPPSDAATTDLLASVEAGRAAWNEARLAPILDPNGQALETMRRATRLESCDWGLEVELGPYTPIAHLARAGVLARLNTLAGIRSSAAGRTDEAVDRWIAGIRFARHVAEGGSLIASLTARVALRSAFEALERAAGGASLNDAQRQRIRSAVAAVPEDGFAWDQAVRSEQRSLDAYILQIAKEPDFARAYQRVVGSPPPAGMLPPAAPAVDAFRRFMDAAVDAFRQPPERARALLQDLEGARKTLHPVYSSLVPSLTRINDTRAEVQAERVRLLSVL